MKKYLFLLMLAAFLLSAAWDCEAQVFYKETFGTAAPATAPYPAIGNYTGYDNGTPIAYSSTSGINATVRTPTGATATHNGISVGSTAFLYTATTNTPALGNFTVSNIPFSNRAEVTLSVDIHKNNPSLSGDFRIIARVDNKQSVIYNIVFSHTTGWARVRLPLKDLPMGNMLSMTFESSSKHMNIGGNGISFYIDNIQLSVPPLSASNTQLTMPVGNNTAVSNLEASLDSYTGNYVWSVTPSAGARLSAADSDAVRKLNFSTTAAAGKYEVTVQRGNSPVYRKTFTLFPANLWAVYNDDDDNITQSFSIKGGTYNGGPTNVFGTGISFAAMGRSDYPSAENGYYYWIPATANNGTFSLYGRAWDGSGNDVAIGSLDVNGSNNNNELGYVRLGVDKNRVAWILAGDGYSTLYLVKVNVDGLAAAVPILEDDDVKLVGGSVSSFKNGDLCFDNAGYMYALANSEAGTEIFIGIPDGANTVLSKKWIVQDTNGNAFNGTVNGCCFDADGGLYLSTSGNTGGVTDGIYYLGTTIVSADISSVEVIKAKLIYAATGYADLGTNVWPDYTVVSVPSLYEDIKAYIKDGILSVDWLIRQKDNCLGYAIQLSYNARDWKQIGWQEAKNEESSVKLKYNFNLAIPTMQGFVFTSFIILFIPFCRKRKKWLAAVLCFAFVAGIAACNKIINRAGSSTTGRDMFVRIVQKNRDGQVHYSITTKVVYK